MEDRLTKLEQQFKDHRHTGLDSRVLAVNLPNQGELTAASASTVDATYGSEEAAVIANNRTRIQEIETALIALGILT